MTNQTIMQAGTFSIKDPLPGNIHKNGMISPSTAQHRKPRGHSGAPALPRSIAAAITANVGTLEEGTLLTILGETCERLLSHLPLADEREHLLTHTNAEADGLKPLDPGITPEMIRTGERFIMQPLILATWLSAQELSRKPLSSLPGVTLRADLIVGTGQLAITGQNRQGASISVPLESLVTSVLFEEGNLDVEMASALMFASIGVKNLFTEDPDGPPSSGERGAIEHSADGHDTGERNMDDAEGGEAPTDGATQCKNNPGDEQTGQAHGQCMCINCLIARSNGEQLPTPTLGQAMNTLKSEMHRTALIAWYQQSLCCHGSNSLIRMNALQDKLTALALQRMRLTVWLDDQKDGSETEQEISLQGNDTRMTTHVKLYDPENSRLWNSIDPDFPHDRTVPASLVLWLNLVPERSHRMRKLLEQRLRPLGKRGR